VVAAHGDFTCKFHKTASKAAGQQMYWIFKGGDYTGGIIIWKGGSTDEIQVALEARAKKKGD
jgi:hypothetical protein